ncbi:MAG: hypothetical protein EOR14_27900 [Mesorhizobium sp.]|nr:MAG: hypothetical protein EOR14_27900 [Mesorhizobium sp.]
MSKLSEAIEFRRPDGSANTPTRPSFGFRATPSPSLLSRTWARSRPTMPTTIRTGPTVPFAIAGRVLRVPAKRSLRLVRALAAEPENRMEATHDIKMDDLREHKKLALAS